jgi:hypothetical protein
MLFHISTLLPLLLLTFSPPTLAGDCIQTPVGGTTIWVCGSVRNSSPWTLRYTTNPDSSTGNGYCQFWNWPEGITTVSKRVKCTQQSLAPGGYAGEDRQGGVDVDGLTFADRDWRFQTKSLQRGVWHKFATTTNVVCDDEGGMPVCYGF